MDHCKIIPSLLLLLYPTITVFPQDQFPRTYFRSPLDIELYLSANFAELRSNHFHSGIDIKTQGVTGHKVYSAAEGYISRIKIESGGYGKTLYITHPKGYTTVYAHLDSFRKDIEKYIKSVQYQQNKHALNIYLQKDEFPVQQSDFIAYSGNSGYSSGPHLHFEIRKAAQQDPVNALLFNLSIKDQTLPRFFSLFIYPLDAQSFVNNSNNKAYFHTEGTLGNYRISDNNPVKVHGRIGFGIEAYDFMDGTKNKYGIYSIEMKMDNELLFFLETNEFSFSETRYINSFIDYEEQQKNNRNVQKTFVDPNNRLSLYKQVVNSGIIEFRDDSAHLVSFIIRDANLNSSQLNVEVRSYSENNVHDRGSENDFTQLFYHNIQNHFERNDIKIELPVNALYNDLKFRYAKSEPLEGTFSAVHHVHDIYTPVHLPYKISIRPVGLPDSLQDKAVIVKLDKEEIWVAMGGEWNNGYVEANISEFGKFLIAADTIGPEIIPLNISQMKDMSGMNLIQFKITDNLSGIRSYDGYIDNTWVLFEYDAKDDLVFFILDPDRLEKELNHELELFIIDNKDNMSSYYAEFYW